MNDNYILGWIKLYRSIRNHWIWADANKLKWWIDILLEVNHSGKKVNIGFDIIECKRGQSVMSLQSWSERWNITKSKTKRFFDLLAKDGMIRTENLIKTTRITVCNYDDYNNTRNGNETQVKRKRNASETETKTNNNEKKEIKIIKDNKFIEFWDSYHKTTKKLKSDKDAAIKHWKKLTEIEKDKAIISIFDYSKTQSDNKYLKKAYKYLRDKNFNDEFEIKKDLSKLKKHVPKIKIG